jgi:hypothetical protein
VRCKAPEGASTSFRIGETTKARLASRATREGMPATALLDQLIVEGIDQLGLCE